MKNPCEARKIKASQILHKIISTHLLTVLTKGVIVSIEQKENSDIVFEDRLGGDLYEYQ